MKIDLEKIFDNCAICNSRHFKFIMLKKKNNIYICRNCANESEHYGNSIWIYSPEEIKRGLKLKRNIAEMKEEEEREAKHREFLRKQHKEYMEMIQSIKFIKPTISSEKVPRKFLKDMPEMKYKTVRKNTNLAKLNDFIVIDTETTGLKPATNELLEISAIKFINKKPVECLTTLIKPKKAISNEITNINNIDNKMVENMPSAPEIMQSFSDFIKGYNLVGYNIDFDLKFLHVNGLEFFNEKREFYDVWPLCKRYFSDCGLYNYKLDTICDFYHIYRPQAHRATEDALATGLLFVDIGQQIIDE